MIKEFLKVNELPQAQEVVEEGIVIHVMEETSNQDSCDNMNEKGIEKQESEKEEQRGKEIILKTKWKLILMFKVNSLALEKSNLTKEAFEQVFKDFVVEHLYYHKPFKEWFLKNNILPVHMNPLLLVDLDPNPS
ncbi:hypothetical protein M9H77_18633 [Catharanthus roseus]|uniref:Uncharacterized protein n=1 Tax=Catharanthus roseus TaxID=4058 RepID=A0ACC0B805_CATRO|nr:hypothetical protein M9H77_18633 [Catharanthus roseus]